jgi:hypothetical protein
MPKVVFIAHPIGGNVQANIKKVVKLCKELHTKDIVPIAPYLQTLQYLNDNIPEERELGIDICREYFKRKTMDELWICGSVISKGMKEEIKLAKKYNIPIKFHNKELEKEIK